MEYLKILQIIISSIIAFYAIKFAIASAENIQSNAFKKSTWLLTDFGIGFIPGVLLTLITQSSIFVLLLLAILYSARFIKLRQVLFVVSGIGIGQSVTGWILVWKPQGFAPIFIGICIVYWLIQKYYRKKELHATVMTLLWFLVAITALYYFKSGWKITREFIDYTTVFSTYTPNSPFLGGTLISLIAQSSTSALTVILGLAATDAITLEYALKATATVGLAWSLHATVFLLLLRNRGVHVFLSYHFYSFIMFGISLFAHEFIRDSLTDTTKTIPSIAEYFTRLSFNAAPLLFWGTAIVSIAFLVIGLIKKRKVSTR